MSNTTLRARPVRLPIALEFDFSNSMEAFGAAILPSTPDRERRIVVNMAAILWCAADNPDVAWRDLTADTVVHELLHVVQHALGRLLHEGEIEQSIEAARGIDRTALPETPQDMHPHEEAIARAERAELILATLTEKIEGQSRRVTNRYGNFDKGWNAAIEAVLALIPERA